jgi:hypothetical protein
MYTTAPHLFRLQYHETASSDITSESVIRSRCGAAMNLSFISYFKLFFIFESVYTNTRSDRFQISWGVLLKESLLHYTE